MNSACPIDCHNASRLFNFKDVRKCVDIIASHPVIGPRYGSEIHQLQSTWLLLLRWEGFLARVFEKVQNSRTTICFVGVSVFVTDDFVRELKTAPFWSGPELIRRAAPGDFPILGDKQLRNANAQDGLNHWYGKVVSTRTSLMTQKRPAL